MFCVKCGKDVGTFRFCPHCGTAVPEKEEAVWAVGMACAHCGGTKLEGDSCAFCGAKLVEAPLPQEDREWDVYDVPYRDFYVGQGYHIEIKKDVVQVRHKKLLRMETKQIAYDQLEGAVYTRWDGGKGQLRFHWRKDGRPFQYEIPLFNTDRCRFYYQVFFVIRMLSPENVPFIVAYPPLDQKEHEMISQKVDLEELFLRHVPCREPAVEELASRCMITAEAAGEFIDTYFDMMLQKAYEDDRRLAARDYHRMMRYRVR